MLLKGAIPVPLPIIINGLSFGTSNEDSACFILINGGLLLKNLLVNPLGTNETIKSICS